MTTRLTHHRIETGRIKSSDQLAFEFMNNFAIDCKVCAELIHGAHVSMARTAGSSRRKPLKGCEDFTQAWVPNSVLEVVLKSGWQEAVRTDTLATPSSFTTRCYAFLMHLKTAMTNLLHTSTRRGGAEPS